MNIDHQSEINEIEFRVEHQESQHQNEMSDMEARLRNEMEDVKAKLKEEIAIMQQVCYMYILGHGKLFGDRLMMD